MRKLKELWDKIGVQFIKFGMVGVSNTVVSLATYYIVYLFWCALGASRMRRGFVTGTLNAYYWNSKFVFERGSKGEVGNKERIPGKNLYFVWDAASSLSSLVALFTGQLPGSITGCGTRLLML